MNHKAFFVIDRDQPVRLYEKRCERGGRVRLSAWTAAAAACVFPLGLVCVHASHAQELQSRISRTADAHPALIFDSHVKWNGWTAGSWDIDATAKSDMRVLPSGVPGFPPGTRLEQHQAHSAVTAEELNWGAENVGVLEIPRFDSLGGTRQLLEVRFSYLIRYNIVVHWQESTFDAHTYAHAWLEAGREIPPFTTQFLGIQAGEGLRYGQGSLRPPYHPAWILPTYAQAAIGFQYDDEVEMWLPDFNHAVVVDDLNDASALIGTGTAQFPTRWFAYEPDISDWVPLGAPPFPPDTVYAPELLSVEFVDALDELVVYYIYAVGDPIFDDGFEEPSLR